MKKINQNEILWHKGLFAIVCIVIIAEYSSTEKNDLIIRYDRFQIKYSN